MKQMRQFMISLIITKPQLSSVFAKHLFALKRTGIILASLMVNRFPKRPLNAHQHNLSYLCDVPFWF